LRIRVKLGHKPIRAGFQAPVGKAYLSGQKGASAILLNTWNFIPVIGWTICGHPGELPLKLRYQDVFVVGTQERQLTAFTEFLEAQNSCDHKLHLS
jgi:hypothetical protein